MNDYGIKRAARRRQEKGWDKTYWCIDLHDVIIHGSYSKDEQWQWVPGAVVVLSWLSYQAECRALMARATALSTVNTSM